LSAALAFGFFTFKFFTKNRFFSVLPGKDLTITGFLNEIPDENNYKYIIKIEKIKGINLSKFKARIISSFPLEIEPGEKFIADIRTFDEESPEQTLRLRAKGIWVSGYFLNGKIKNIENDRNWYDIFYTYLLKSKYKIVKKINKIFNSETAVLVNAMWLGRKTVISNDVKDDFSEIGASHILAISGIHVSIFSQFLYILLKFLRFGLRKLCIICAGFVLIFMFVTCFAPSVMRAGIMAIIFFLGKAFFRRSDSLNSLAISLLLISLALPESCLDIGLWLSFLSTLGIILISNNLNNFLKSKINFNNNKILNYLLSNISVSVSAVLFTFPITAWFFLKISLLTIISNILIIFPVTILLNFAIIAVMLSFFGNPLFWGHTTNFVAKYILFTSKYLSKLPFASINLNFSFIILWISFVLILISFAVIFMDFKKEILKISLLSAILLFTGILSHQFAMRNRIRLFILSNSQSLIISELSRNIVIFDSKTTENLKNNLKTLNLKIPDLIINYSGEPRNNIFSSAEKMLLLKKTRRDFIKISVWQNLKLLIFKIKDKIWIQIKTGGNVFLASLSGGNAHDLPHNLRICNMFIAYKLPNNFNIIKSDKILLAMNRHFCEINSKKIKNFQVFSSNGRHVILDIDDNEYFLKRKI
jgi:ComEC/Rec2-related protein